MKKSIILALSILIAVSMSACGSSSSVSSSVTDNEVTSASELEDTHSVQHGELLSWYENDFDGKKVLVVKAKIKPSWTNELTVNQNYYNVADIIKKQNGSEFDEIQYWAVADMTDGSENKVISFTLNKETINAISDGSIVDNQIGNYAEDLFVHKSLQ